VTDDDREQLSKYELAPRIRTFPCVGGWAVIFFPLDLYPERRLARMFMGEYLGISPDELVDLRPRTHVDDDNPELTFWAFGLRPAAVRRWRRRAAIRRLREWRSRRRGTPAQWPDPPGSSNIQ
jgi:hypothetical protein